MNAMITKRVNGKNVYLSCTGRWIKSKGNARVFGNVEQAREEAAKHGASVCFYTFRNF